MEHIRRGKANIIIDGQWGSTGKGKLAGYLALRHDVNLISCNFMTNAGHTWVSDSGEKIMVQQLPSGLVNGDALLCLNAGAMITLPKLLEEIERYNIKRNRIFIHPHAGIIRDVDREAEGGLDRISSTKKGCGAALKAKVMRELPLAKDYPEIKDMVADTSILTQGVLSSGGTVIVETAQGFDLSLNHGLGYPHTTSRDVTTMTALNDAGVPPAYLGEVWGSLRTYPIRVGNMRVGDVEYSSGPFYKDQRELTWKEIAQLSGSKEKIEERTTVTNKIRRVFTFSNTQLRNFVSFNQPTKLFINFVNYWDNKISGSMMDTDISESVDRELKNMRDVLRKMDSIRIGIPSPEIALLGTGPRDSEMIDVGRIYS